MSVASPLLDRVVIIQPTETSSCVGGLYNSYSEELPPQLEHYISENEFTEYMDSINDTLLMHWPCCLGTTLAWMCCPCTLGLSVLFPRICTNLAESETIERIGYTNQLLASDRIPLSFKLVRSGCSSAIHVTILD